MVSAHGTMSFPTCNTTPSTESHRLRILLRILYLITCLGEFLVDGIHLSTGRSAYSVAYWAGVPCIQHTASHAAPKLEAPHRTAPEIRMT